MAKDSPKEITILLQRWRRDGDKEAYNELTSLVYGELHRRAHIYMRRERSGHPLQTTELVNKAWIRLLGARQVDWQDRAHFFAIAAIQMRRILVDIARKRNYDKGSGPIIKIPFEGGLDISAVPDPDLVELNDALDALERFDPRKVRVVELKFFVGLTLEEIAEVLKISRDAVKNDWSFAKAWLKRELCNRGKK